MKSLLSGGSTGWNGNEKKRKIIQGDGWVKQGVFGAPERDTWDNPSILPEDDDPAGFLQTMEERFRREPVNPAALNQTLEDHHYHLKRHYRNKYGTLTPNDYRLIENEARQKAGGLEYANIMGTAERIGPERAKSRLQNAVFMNPTLYREAENKVDLLMAEKNTEEPGYPRPENRFLESGPQGEPVDITTKDMYGKEKGHESAGKPLTDRPDVSYNIIADSEESEESMDKGDRPLPEIEPPVKDERPKDPMSGVNPREPEMGMGKPLGWHPYTGNPKVLRYDPALNKFTAYDYFTGEVDMEFTAVSGTGKTDEKRNYLPAGYYSLPNAPGQVGKNNKKEASFRDKKGFRWFQKIKPMFSTKRFGFGIHPDGNVPGTEGCIGIKKGDTKEIYNWFRKNWDQVLYLEVPYPRTHDYFGKAGATGRKKR